MAKKITEDTLRALRAKALYGEGSERDTAIRFLNKVGVSIEEGQQDVVLHEPGCIEPGDNLNGLTMKDVYGQYGDIFNVEPIPPLPIWVYVVFGIVVLIVFCCNQ